MVVVAEGVYLCGLYFADQAVVPRLDLGDRRHVDLPELCDQLKAYFAGGRTVFDVSLRLVGSPFQRRVWAALQTVPCGQTVSYAELARMVGQPTACSAVGAANGKNPVSIVVPCHRVLGRSGSLTGYAGGLDRKRALLLHEQAVVQRPV